MKKTHKRALGLFGLAAVVATTVFAATLPDLEASAITNVEDTITVRVVGNKPDINIISPESGSTVVSPTQDIHFTYEDVDKITIIIVYTDPDGQTHEYLYDEINADYNAGEYSGTIDLSGADYGYGEYEIKIEGEGAEGVPGTDSIKFSYYPASATIEQTPGTGDGTSGGQEGTAGGSTGGDYTISFKYDTESGLGSATGATILINENVNGVAGNLIKEIPIAAFPTDSYRLILSNYGLPSGDYIITIRIAYQYNGKTYYAYYTYNVSFRVPSREVPNTGSFMGDLNISKTDYLVTGLIVFGIVGVGGFMFVAKKGKKTTRRRR
ncbi:hypothetical protein IKG64_01585 [Candidatus Saccharibacteria bacterium]|nr:hypothetical protein [Candidatus Saccharibacteria bacterium]